MNINQISEIIKNRETLLKDLEAFLEPMVLNEDQKLKLEEFKKRHREISNEFEKQIRIKEKEEKIQEYLKVLEYGIQLLYMFTNG